MHADTLSQLVKVRHYVKEQRASGVPAEAIMEKLSGAIKSSLK